MAFLKHPDSLYIGGEFVKASDAVAVINPADESLIMMAPVGGIKRSGYGREYGVDGLNEFTYIKSIAFHGG